MAAMTRYVGLDLPPSSRVAVIANDAIGNFVVATPLLQLLRKELRPSHLHYFGGKRTMELQLSSDLFDCSFPLHGSTPAEVDEMIKQAAAYDLVINLENTAFAKAIPRRIVADEGLICGPCLTPEDDDLPFEENERGRLWGDSEWARKSLTTDYPFLQTGHISEIYCRLAYLSGDVPGYCVPKEEFDSGVDVILATTASLPEKLWPIEKWLATVEWLRGKGLKVGLVGAAPKAQKEHWKGADEEGELVSKGGVVDLRGKLSLPQVVGALERARLVFSLDNGILHLAVAARTPTVGLFREGIHRLWAPPSDDLTVLIPSPGEMVERISVEQAIGALTNAL